VNRPQPWTKAIAAVIAIHDTIPATIADTLASLLLGRENA